MATEKPPIVKPAAKDKLPRRRRGGPRWVIAILFLLLLAFLGSVIIAAYFAGSPAPGPQGRPHSFSAGNSSSSRCTESTQGYAMLPGGTLLIRTASDHPLLAETGKQLATHLTQLPAYPEVQYCATRGTDQPGEAAPAATLLLEIDDLQETPRDQVARSAALELKSTIHMTVANSLLRCRAQYHDHLDAPIVTYQFDCRLEHESTAKGVAADQTRYRAAAENIAEQLASILTDKLYALSEQYPPLATMPPQLYPAYRPPPQIPVPADEPLVMLHSHHGFLHANETLWQFSSTRAIPAVLTGLATAFEQQQWTRESLETEDNQIAHLRLKLGATIVTVYPQESTASARAQSAQRTERPPGAPRTFFVHYLDRMDRQQLDASCQQLMTADTPLHTLLVLSHLLNDQQWKQVAERIVSDQSNLPAAWLMLAQRNHKRDPQQATRWLQRAQLLQRVALADQRVDDQIEQLAQQLELPHPLRKLPSVESLQQAGFIELAAGGEVAARDLAVQEPACFYLRSEDSQIQTVAVWISQLPGPAATPRYTLTCRTCRTSLQSETSGGMRAHRHFPGVGNIVFDAQPLGQSGQFRLRVELPAGLATAR